MQALFSSAIALLMLFGYVYLLMIAGAAIECITTPGCTEYTTASFNDNMTQALSVIGGLVSALVIAELAITKPGEAPVARVLTESATDGSKNALKVVTACYILVWLGAGVYAFYISLHQPKALPEITSLGQAWLGLAVASSYAYFGLKPR
jgi:hypothetical protein